VIARANAFLSPALINEMSSSAVLVMLQAKEQERTAFPKGKLEISLTCNR
jgi:hypothetical protein